VNGLRIIIIVSIAFTAAEWGSVDVRFGVTILGVAFIAFLAGQRWPWRQRKARPTCVKCRQKRPRMASPTNTSPGAPE
jgi:hypothetical protein